MRSRGRSIHKLPTLAFVLIAVLSAAIVGACSSGSDAAAIKGPETASFATQASSAATPEATTAATPIASPRFAEAPPSDWDGPTVHLDQLSAAALETLMLIAADGPYPYDQDGSTFQNREGILPDRPSGFYHEYTVQTPGSPDRGARRLVVGGDDAAYYTDDHYDSFRFVAP